MHSPALQNRCCFDLVILNALAQGKVCVLFTIPLLIYLLKAHRERFTQKDLPLTIKLQSFKILCGYTHPWGDMTGALAIIV